MLVGLFTRSGRLIKPAADKTMGVTRAPMFSVLMRTTGRSAAVATALRSVAAQTIDKREYEVVVINDGGPTVADVVRKWDDGLAVQLVELDVNVGKSKAINEAFRQSLGRYVCILDDDDAFLPDHLAELTGRLADHPEIAVLYTDTEIVSDSPSGRESIGARRWQFDPAELFMMRGAPIACSICIRRDAWTQVDGFDDELTRVLDDWDFYMRLSLQFEFIRIPVVTSRYTQPPSDKVFRRLPSFELGLQHLRQKLSGETIPLNAGLALDLARETLDRHRATGIDGIAIDSLRDFAGSTPQDVALERPMASIEVLEPSRPTTMSTLSMATFTIRVENAGDETWCSDSGRHPINLSYHWARPGGEIASWEGARTVLPYDIVPGQSLTTRLLVLAPESAGTYQWIPSVVQEGQCWFGDTPGGHDDAIAVQVDS